MCCLLVHPLDRVQSNLFTWYLHRKKGIGIVTKMEYFLDTGEKQDHSLLSPLYWENTQSYLLSLLWQGGRLELTSALTRIWVPSAIVRTWRNIRSIMCCSFDAGETSHISFRCLPGYGETPKIYHRELLNSFLKLKCRFFCTWTIVHPYLNESKILLINNEMLIPIEVVM